MAFIVIKNPDSNLYEKSNELEDIFYELDNNLCYSKDMKVIIDNIIELTQASLGLFSKLTDDQIKEGLKRYHDKLDDASKIIEINFVQGCE